MITTKFIPATNHKPNRIKATYMRGPDIVTKVFSASTMSDKSGNTGRPMDCHVQAAKEFSKVLVEEHGITWMSGKDMQSAYLPGDASIAHVPILKSELWKAI